MKRYDAGNCTSILPMAIAVIALLPVSAPGQVNPDDLTLPNAATELEIATVLRSDGPGLAGDVIERASGNLSLRQVDISLPGQSPLPVEFARNYRIDGIDYLGNVLGGWTPDVPFLTMRLDRDLNYQQVPWSQGSGTDYCFSDGVPFLGSAPPEARLLAWHGIKMSIPGKGIKQLRAVPSTSIVHDYKDGSWGIGAETGTTIDGWKIECGPPVQNTAGIGVRAISPEGWEYRFDYFMKRYAGFEAFSVSSGGGRGGGTPVLRVRQTEHFNLMATRVTHPSGAYVDYTYDSLGYLTQISGSDGRTITLTYNSPTHQTLPASADPLAVPWEALTKRIATVSAHGSTWQYAYASPSDDNYHTANQLNLREVQLPDGRKWKLNLPLQNNRATEYYNSYLCQDPDKAAETGYTGSWVKRLPDEEFVIHPNGARVDFEFQIIKNMYVPTGSVGVGQQESLRFKTHGGSYKAYCSLMNLGFTPTRAVTKKRITGSEIGPEEWLYGYEQGNYCPSPSVLSRSSKFRTTDQPDGSKIAEHLACATPYYYDHNQALRTTFHDGPVLLQQVDYTYKADSDSGLTQGFGYHYDPTGLKREKLALVATRDTTQQGNTYSTEYTYNTNFGTSNYSFGRPTQIDRSSDLQSGVRTSLIAYSKISPKWIMAQISTIDRNGVRFDEAIYNGIGQLITHKRFGSVWSTFGYHTHTGSKGALAWRDNAIAQRTSFNNYKRGLARQVVRRDSTTISRTVDDHGRVTSVTNGRGQTTGYSYNAAGWITSIDRPGSWADSTITYSGIGSSVTQTETRGTLRSITTYDPFTRPIEVRKTALSGGGGTIYRTMAYDVFGGQTFESFSSSSPAPIQGVNTAYDGLGRPTTISENVAPFATTSFAYLSSNRTRITDPVGAVETTRRSGYGTPGDGEVVEVIDALGAVTALTHDIHGNITTLTQSGTQNGYTSNASRQFWYDSRFRLCRHRAPEKGDELYSYDTLDRRLYEASGLAAGAGCNTPPSGSRTEYTYDPLDRVTLVNYPSTTADITTTYDNDGNPKSVTRGTSVWSYNWNALDKLTQEKLVVDGRTYQLNYNYNATGSLLGRTRGGQAQLEYLPDGFGRPNSVRQSGQSYVSGTTYHPNGLVKTGTYLNQQALTQTLNARQLLSTARAAVSGGSVAIDFTYSYDGNRRVTGISDAATSSNRSHVYDLDGRLLSASGPWGNATYKYDAIDNLRKRTFPSRTVNIGYSAAKNQVTSVADTGQPTRTFTHDSRGNVTSDGKHTLTYDWSNQPISISGSGVSASHTYDGNKRRVKSIVGGTTTYYVYSALDGALVLKDDVTNSIISEYVSVGPLGVRLANGAPTYVHRDHLGSPVAASNPSGAILWRETYMPFGEPMLGPTGNADDRGFTGHVADSATGLVYMQARYYDPVIGRFLQTDPIGYRDQLNLYAYVANDPVNSVDPTGESGQWLACAGGPIPCAVVGAGGTAAIWLIYSSTPAGQKTNADIYDSIVSLSENSADDSGSSDDSSSEDGDTSGDIVIDDKIRDQMGPRGWTEDDIRDAIDAGPIGNTRDDTRDPDTGEKRDDPATVYGSKDDGHVIVNDETGRVIQVTDKTRDDWIPDDRIDWNED